MGTLQLGQQQGLEARQQRVSPVTFLLFKVKALPAALATAPIIDSSFQQAFIQ